MAYTVNRVTLLGNLGGDPTLRYTANGQAICNFSMATRKVWKNKAGEKQERTDWHKICVWGTFAEICGQRLAKGTQVYVEGELSYNEWTDKDGQKRRQAEVVASQVVFTGQQRAEGLNEQGRGGSQSRAPTPEHDLFGEPGDDREPPF